MTLIEFLTLIAITVPALIAIYNMNITRKNNKEATRGRVTMTFKQIGRYKVFKIKNTGNSNIKIIGIKLSRELTNQDVILGIKRMDWASNEKDSAWLGIYENKQLSAGDKIIEYLNFGQETPLYSGVIITITYSDIYNKIHEETFEIFPKLFETAPGVINSDSKETYAQIEALNNTISQRLSEINDKLD